MKIYRTVKLEVELIAELDKLKHPGQTLSGVIQETVRIRLELAEANKIIKDFGK